MAWEIWTTGGKALKAYRFWDQNEVTCQEEWLDYDEWLDTPYAEAAFQAALNYYSYYGEGMQ